MLSLELSLNYTTFCQYENFERLFVKFFKEKTF